MTPKAHMNYPLDIIKRICKSDQDTIFQTQILLITFQTVMEVL